MSLKYKPLPIWKPLYDKEWDVFIAIGSRASGKTWNVANFATLETLNNFKHRSLIVRETKESIEESILKEIKDRFEAIDSQTGGVVSQYFDVQKTQISNKKSKINNILIKGFRETRTGLKTDLKGFSGINLVVLEETEDIRDEERVRVLFDTLREANYKIIIVLNTPDLEHWVIKRFFDYEMVAETVDEKFYKITPKEYKGVKQLVTTYLDNPFLTQRKVDEYNSYKEPSHYNYDLNHYYKHILGYATEAENLARLFSWSKLNDLQTVKPIKVINVEGYNVNMYRQVVNNLTYVIGIDVATGQSEDFTTFTVRSMELIDNQHKLFFSFKEKCNATNIALIVFKLAQILGAFNTYISPELNGYGDAVIDKLEELNYYKTYILGRRTNDTIRRRIVTKYAESYKNSEIDLDDLLKEECKTFIFNPKNNRYEHANGKHDDLLFADMHCLETIRELQSKISF